MADNNENAGGRGATTIADSVVAKIAAITARNVSGIHTLGGTPSQALGAVRRRVGGSGITQGVSVQTGQTQAAVDLTVVDYDLPIHKVAQQARENGIHEVKEMTGLKVVEVNIAVTDVHIESEDESETEEGSGDTGPTSRRSLR